MIATIDDDFFSRLAEAVQEEELRQCIGMDSDERERSVE
jgi:hypothetical protein